jgi:hypothetical protein
MEVEIKPAPRSNPEGRDDLPWNIWKDGVNTNVKPTKAEAEIAVQNLLHKASPSTVLNADVPAKHFMDVIPQRGTPKIGSRVKFDIYDEECVGEVVEHLSTQFIVEWPYDAKKRKTYILRVDDAWSVVS